MNYTLAKFRHTRANKTIAAIHILLGLMFLSDITYFDPNHERRVDGLEALKSLLGPIKGMQLPLVRADNSVF